METDYKLVWREIGFENKHLPELKSTIRFGWAIKIGDMLNYDTYAWIEGNNLVVYDSLDYYPTGLYEIPFELILELKSKNEENKK